MVHARTKRFRLFKWTIRFNETIRVGTEELAPWQVVVISDRGINVFQFFSFTSQLYFYFTIVFPFFHLLNDYLNFFRANYS